MRNELDFKLTVQPSVDAVLNMLDKDGAQYGVEAEELNKAVFVWLMARLRAGSVPEWFLEELNKHEEV